MGLFNRTKDDDRHRDPLGRRREHLRRLHASTRATPASASPPATRWSRRSAASSTSSRAPPTSTPSTPANSSVTVTIQAASVTTGNEQRDGHLKTPDFFDIANYPQITFVSTNVERDGTEWDITGDLTINGVTKSVTIPFEETGSAKDPFGNTRVGFEGDVTIDRTEWNLSFNAALETGGVLVSEKVKLEFDVSAIANVPAEV